MVIKFVKKKDQKLEAKCDSFVLETNVHFPTDSSLLYDAVRKIIQLTACICEKYHINGWRQKNHNIKKIKSSCTNINNIKKSNPKKPIQILKKENNLKKEYAKLIQKTNFFINESNKSLNFLKNEMFRDDINIDQIKKYIYYAELFIDQIKRRVFNKEIIPHEEKVFSIFEPHTEWICKGKAKAPFELGKRVAVVEDQFGFILHGIVMDKKTDDKVAVHIAQIVKSKFKCLSSLSFDKGFYSRENKEKLLEILDFVVLPKKGKLSKKDKELEGLEEFKRLRKKHSAIESAINALEVHGLDRCLDKGVNGFNRYVALAIASRNIQKIGDFILYRLKKKRSAA